MASETGHAKNVANFEDLISFCTGYGTAYNPSKASIKLPALNTLFTSAKGTLTTINTTLPPNTNAVNAREIVFIPLSKLITRVINALEASSVPKQVVADAKTLARKIQGKRASEKLPTVVDDPNTPEDESQKSISASQMSFDSRIENMDKLIQLLAAQTGYADTFGEKENKKITTKKFKEILLSIQDKSMKEQEKYLDDFIENWKAGTEQVDDILVIGIRV